MFHVEHPFLSVKIIFGNQSFCAMLKTFLKKWLENLES